MSRALHALDPKRFGDLPERQQQVLDFVKVAIANDGNFPSLRKIAEHMGWKNEGSALDCLYRLQWRGVVKRSSAAPKRQGAAGYRWELVER